MEAIGVATGKIFGSYHYGSNMHLKVLGVPLLDHIVFTQAGKFYSFNEKGGL